MKPLLHRLIALFLAALCAASLGGSVSARDFSAVAIVNDRIITNFDVEQRARLLSAASGGSAGASALRSEALESLIDDALRLQAAARAGIEPDAEQIRAGFAEISRLNGRDPERMRAFFAQQGVTEQALDAQIAAEVAWRALIRARYAPRIRVSDAEIDAEMAPQAAALGVAAPDGGGVEYLLAEIRFPYAPYGGTEAGLRQGAAYVRQLSSGAATFADLARQASRGASAASGGDLGWTPASALSPEMARVAGRLQADRVSAPFIDGDDVVILGMRAVRERGGAGTAPAYRLAQIVVGAAPDVSGAQADAAYRRAAQARGGFQGCDAPASYKSGAYLPISGDLGTMRADQMPGAVREAVASLAPGEVSQPVRSNDGFHVIKLCERIDAESAAASPSGGGDRDRVRERLMAEKLERHARNLMRELRREAVIERR